MASNPPPPRRYPTGRSETKVPCLEYPSSSGASSPSNSRRHRFLVFFIPGNPGLASYYVPFLKTLRGLLDETERKLGGEEVGFDIYSSNLLGFDDSDHGVPFGRKEGEGEDQGEALPFCLEDQICWVGDVISGLDDASGEGDGEGGRGRKGKYDGVILMGHSVGAYIAMEIFHRQHLGLQKKGRELTGEGDGDGLYNFNLKAGIMLFPTVWDIAKSPNGLKLDMLRKTTFFDRYGHHVAKWLVDLFPRWVLEGIVRRVMRFSAEGAAVTADFVTSRDGIWQSLHLAKDEMASITGEKWEKEMWEAAEEVDGGEVDKFYFLFGKKDHWVADETRDVFIEKRKAHDDGRVRIEVDDSGVPHAFCIHHSEVVAERVRGWIDEIAGAR